MGQEVITFSARGTGPRGIATRLGHCLWFAVFLAPTRDKAALFAVFLGPQNRAETLVFTMFSQQPKKQV